MRKILIILVFTIGLSIFSYPIVSNMLATSAHQSEIGNYRDTVEKLDKLQLEKEKEKVNKHNRELASSDLNFVDPFSEDGGESTGGNSSYFDALNIGLSIGTVTIPEIDVELPIYHGSSEEVLSQGAGHLENSSLPSGQLGTHSVITAHRGLPTATMFRYLDKLEIGDTFKIEVLNEVLTYRISEVKNVLPSETTWLTMNEEKNQATLLTCEPYMINTHRMLVTGDLVSSEADQKPIKEKNDNQQDDVITAASILLGTIVAFVIVIMSVKRRKSRKEQ